VGQRASHPVLFAGLGWRAVLCPVPLSSSAALELAEAGGVVPPEQTYCKLHSLLKQVLKTSYNGFVLL